MKRDLLLKTLRNTTGAALYIFLVSQVMSHGKNWFGPEESIFIPFAILLLFSLSAAVVGSLVFGQSVLLTIQKKYGEAVKAAIYSIGWLAIYTVLGFTILIVLK